MRKTMELITLEKYSINERVPNNRRQVLVWGYTTILGHNRSDIKILGTTKFNPGGIFDIEIRSSYNPFYTVVTHWSELV